MFKVSYKLSFTDKQGAQVQECEAEYSAEELAYIGNNLPIGKDAKNCRIVIKVEKL